MEINVLCFSIYGNQESTAWAGITIEDGDISQFSGAASSDLEAILFGLYECLETLPSPTPIMIRCSERLPNDVGKKCIPQWKAQGFGEEEFKEDIQVLLALLAPRKCLWSKPVLINDMDRKVQKLAKERFAKGVTKGVSKDATKSVAPDISISESKPSLSTNIPKESSIKEPMPEENRPLISKEISKEHKPKSPASLQTKTPPPQPPLEPEIPQILFQSQILIYIDAISTGNIGAWGFILIDRKSQHALLKASGHRHSNFQTNLLQGCISGLQSLRSPDFLIEIRSRHSFLIQLGQQWLSQWSGNSWRKRNGEEPKNLPFLQELHRILQTMTPSWRHIPQESEEKGLLDCHKITQDALNQLNYGGKAQIEHRIPKYPIDQLL